MQSRTSNIPIYLLFSIISWRLDDLNLSSFEVTTTIILLQHVSFFAMGGSNAISSIDLSSAYNGIRGFNVVAVGLLTFIGNWAGPIWWASRGASMLVSFFHKRSEDRITEEPSKVFRGDSLAVENLGGKVQQQHVALLTVFVTAHLVFVMVACTILRTHLFIWTVFSPKFLYSMAWSLGVHFLVNIGLGGSFFALG